jgi:hypothetical protein
LLIGTPVALAFALVLAADAPFRRALAGMLGGAGHGLDFMFWTVATLCALLVAHAVLWRLREAHATEAVSVAAAPAGPYRATSDLEGFTQAVGPAGPRLRPLTWSVVLAQVVAVFGVYVAVSARSLFATHAHLREHGTTTYSAYLHEGFGQVTLAALLAVACVGVGHVMLRPRGETTARIAGGRGLVVVELLLLSLVAVTLASCAHRLSLYEEAYGFTYQRLGVWVLQLGIAGLLAMMAARCLARAWQGFASALVWAGLALLVGAGSFDADLWIARRNLALVPAAARGACGDFPTNLVHADLDYLATLSEDARSVVHEGGLCPWETRQLDEAWIDKARAHRLGGWRSLRGLGVR